jgi:hypothetical protein
MGNGRMKWISPSDVRVGRSRGASTANSSSRNPSLVGIPNRICGLNLNIPELNLEKGRQNHRYEVGYWHSWWERTSGDLIATLNASCWSQVTVTIPRFIPDHDNLQVFLKEPADLDEETKGGH